MKTKIKNNQERGITLIALVVTIVVLLILAGVSISLVLNNNGVISKAKDAKNQYAEAQTNEEKHFNEVTDWIDTKVGDTTGGSVTFVDGVPIPAGFVYVGGTKDSGLVISDSAEDKDKYKGEEAVGTELVGNQFVWIPVDNIADYKRIWYTGDGASNFENYSETLPDDEKTSVENNKGYYIGRYEAGDKESTNLKTLRNDSSSDSNTITLKVGQAPYTGVTRRQAKSLSESFSTKQEYTSVKSKLVSSYAWDTAIAFIQKTNSDYGSSSEEGNYRDTTFTYTDITGASQTKSSSTLIPTGQTTAVNNIYDMGGNAWEWTTEIHSNGANPYTIRGGDCYTDFGASPGSRYYSSDAPFDTCGFRITLFL